MTGAKNIVREMERERVNVNVTARQSADINQLRWLAGVRQQKTHHVSFYSVIFVVASAVSGAE